MRWGLGNHLHCVPGAGSCLHCHIAWLYIHSDVARNILSLQVIIMEYAGAGLSVDSSGKKWDYYRQVPSGFVFMSVIA